MKNYILTNWVNQKEKTIKFLILYNLTRPNYEEIEKMSIPITCKDIESIIKSLPTKKTPGPDGVTGEFYQTSKEEIIPIFNILFLQREYFLIYCMRPALT